MKHNSLFIRMPLFLLCIIITLTALFSGCSGWTWNGEHVYHFSNLGELREAVNFDFLLPAQLPDGYIRTKNWAVGNSMIRIAFSNGKNTIVFSSSDTTEDPSGENGPFAEETTETISGYSVLIRKLTRSDSRVLAVVIGEEYSFSLSSITPEELSQVLAQMDRYSELSNPETYGREQTECADEAALQAVLGFDLGLPEYPAGSTIRAVRFFAVGTVVGKVLYTDGERTYCYYISADTSARDMEASCTADGWYTNSSVLSDIPVSYCGRIIDGAQLAEVRSVFWEKYGYTHVIVMDDDVSSEVLQEAAEPFLEMPSEAERKVNSGTLPDGAVVVTGQEISVSLPEQEDGIWTCLNSSPEILTTVIDQHDSEADASLSLVKFYSAGTHVWKFSAAIPGNAVLSFTKKVSDSSSGTVTFTFSFTVDSTLQIVQLAE